MTDDTLKNPKSMSRVSIFGVAPILPCEDAAAYDSLLEDVIADVKPIGIIEEILIRDIVDITWEILRWRRIRTDLITQATATALGPRLSIYQERGSTGRMIPNRLVPPAMQELVAKWARKNPDAIKRVNKLLTTANTTIDAVTTDATIKNLDIIERIDRLITIAEARRNEALREIDRHRFALAQAMRGKIKEIEDAEFKTIEPVAPQIESEENAA